MKTVIVLISLIVLTHEARFIPAVVPGTTYGQVMPAVVPGTTYGQVVPAEVIATPQGYAVFPVAGTNTQFSRMGTPMAATSPVVEVVEVPVVYTPRRDDTSRYYGGWHDHQPETVKDYYLSLQHK
jgi:hypothetical protein